MSDFSSIESSDTQSSIDIITIPINEKRKNHVNFTIIYVDQATGKKFKYGVEKSIIASSSSFFNNLFEVCNSKDQPQKEELELMDNFSADIVSKALQVLSGVHDLHAWTIDESSDLIDFGTKYDSENVVHCGLQKFCQAYAKDAHDKKEFHSRFEEAAIVKFISLWRRGLMEEPVWSEETGQMYLWCMQDTWRLWCKHCNTNTTEAEIVDFLSYETSKYFSGEDIYAAINYINELKTITLSQTDLVFPSLDKVIED